MFARERARERESERGLTLRGGAGEVKASFRTRYALHNFGGCGRPMFLRTYEHYFVMNEFFIY
jgi:hypothetical protein